MMHYNIPINIKAGKFFLRFGLLFLVFVLLSGSISASFYKPSTSSFYFSGSSTQAAIQNVILPAETNLKADDFSFANAVTESRTVNLPVNQTHFLYSGLGTKSSAQFLNYFPTESGCAYFLQTTSPRYYILFRNLRN